MFGEKWITVILNDEGAEEYEYGGFDTPNMKEYQLPYDEFDILWDVFEKTNAECHTLIDDYESEELKGEQVDILMRNAQGYEEKCPVFFEALNAAKAYRHIGFDF